MSVIKKEYLLDRITRNDLLPLSFLKKSAYTGSRDKLRYKIEKAETGEEPEIRKILRVYTWITPFAFDKTPEEELTVKDFDFSDEAVNQIASYLNICLEESRKS